MKAKWMKARAWAKAAPHRAMDLLCIWAVRWATRRRPQLLMRYIMERASELGVAATMASLDRERIAHCYRCPARFGLKRMGSLWTCGQHELKKEEANPKPVPAAA